VKNKKCTFVVILKVIYHLTQELYKSKKVPFVPTEGIFFSNNQVLNFSQK